MKKIMIFMIILLMLSTVFATCTLTLDKTEYRPSETATATMSCSSVLEKNKAYTVTWTNGTSTVETDTGTTPSSTNTAFFETLIIPSSANWTNANATLTGTSLEGFDSFNVSGNATNKLIITNVLFGNTARLGERFAVEFEVQDVDGNKIDSSHCRVYGTDDSNAPLMEADRESHTIDGKAISSGILYANEIDEDTPYLAKISCHCEIGDEACWTENSVTVEKRQGSTAIPFELTSWLVNVSTITDKSSYNVDEDILVCANITNADLNDRVSVNINYNWRCQNGDGDASTDRVVFESHLEERGISANTTQNQCAKFQIPNDIVIEEGATNCYGATSVTVLDDTKNGIVTYDTTSSIFTLDVYHVHPVVKWSRDSRNTYTTNVDIDDYDVGVKHVGVDINPTMATSIKDIESYSVTYENGSAISYSTSLNTKQVYRNLEHKNLIAVAILNVNTTLDESFNVTVVLTNYSERQAIAGEGIWNQLLSFLGWIKVW